MELSEFEKNIQNGEWVGIVEDNIDPDKKQRVRIRIPYLHGDIKDIPTTSLPWAHPFRDNNGISFSVPDINKIVNVTFPSGNLYYPVYKNAQHLNINLQKKIEEYSGDDYATFISLCYNHNTQIFIDNETGLNLIHKFNGINIKKDQIAINLKDNQSTLYLGDDKAAQELVLGTNFFEWFDTLMQTLLDAYIGNSGAPCVANPNLINVYNQYQSKKSTFVSEHIFAPENNKIRTKDFDVNGQLGDKIKQTNKDKELNINTVPIEYKPKQVEKDLDERNEYVAPPTDGSPDDTEMPPNENIAPKTDNERINKMINYLKSQNYIVYETPYRLNIVGIRNSAKDKGIISNKFDDKCWVFYVDKNGEWQLQDDYRITTTPGYEPKKTHLPKGPGGAGVATLTYAQFVDKWKLGFHQNRTGKPGGKKDKNGNLAPQHRCLRDAKTAHFRNESSGTSYALPGQNPIKTAGIGINIHHAGESGVSTNVYNWSEGCMVFASRNQHDEFIKLCDQQVEKTNIGTFTFTLIPQKEFDNFK